jgi:putative tributyrin esterase
MIHTEVRFSSAALGMRVTMNVLLPEQFTPPFATLYLLHGLSDDHSIWGRLSRVEAYAWNLPLAIVMPQGFRGFYTKNVAGPDYIRYMMQDVIGTAERLFPLRRDREGRCIGGLSMGGYGALRLALAHPDQFVSAHSHSGALLVGTIGVGPGSVLGQEEYERVFGKKPAGTEHDLTFLAQRAVQTKQPLPKISLDCGTADFLIEQNRGFHAALKQLNIPHHYDEHGGDHNWDYWDAHIPAAMAFHLDAMGLPTTKPTR